MNKKIREYGIEIGGIKTGKNNSITDVDGVKVGNITLKDGKIQTGVTAILPHTENMFQDKLIAASYVINGFGKSTGLVQIDELGTIETPIILTNTFGVGLAHNALVKYMLDINDDIGDTTGTVNPVVCECNDGLINDIRGIHISEEDVMRAIRSAGEVFDEGDVGAGTGMICYDLKGGIGSSSRIIKLGDREYTIGILVLSNFGLLEDFILNGEHIGEDLCREIGKEIASKEQGSIIAILATDIPLSSRQLKRVIKRVFPGISRTGSYSGSGSGEIVIGFSTANTIRHYEREDIIDIKILNEDKIDSLFKATVHASEEAILNSMICAESNKDRKGKKIYSLKELIR